MADVIGISRRPSSADRWLGTEAEPGCSASVYAVKDEKPSPSSKYADKGSLAHLVFERARKERRDPAEFIGLTDPSLPGQTVDADMADHVRNGLVYVDTVLASDPALFAETETKVPIRFGDYGTEGKCDYFYVAESLTLHVFDYKHGEGISVSAYDNPQGTLYALGVMQVVMRLGVNLTKVVIHIVQPPRDNYSTFEITPDQMYNFAQRAHYASLESETVNADGSVGVFRPGKKACQWCPIKLKCPARTAHAGAAVSNRFALLPSGPPPLETALGKVDGAALAEARDKMTLTDAQLEGIYPHLKAVKKWAEDMADYIFAKAMANPEAFPNLKFVAGNGARSFKSRGAAIVAMLEAGLTSDEIETGEPPILTAAAAHSVLRKKFKKKQGDTLYEEKLLPVIDVIEGKTRPLLVAATDPREAITLDSDLAAKFGITQQED